MSDNLENVEVEVFKEKTFEEKKKSFENMSEKDKEVIGSIAKLLNKLSQIFVVVFIFAILYIIAILYTFIYYLPVTLINGDFTFILPVIGIVLLTKLGLSIALKKGLKLPFKPLVNLIFIISILSFIYSIVHLTTLS